MITAQQVNELRKSTNLPVMDCKKALIESNGDYDKAVEILRINGKIKAAKKVQNETLNGVLMCDIDSYCEGNQTFNLVEVLCQTDFVAKNQKFIDFAKWCVKQLRYKNFNQIVQPKIDELIVEFGENIKIGKTFTHDSLCDMSLYYNHHNKIVGFIAYDGDNTEKVYDCAMHLVAKKPKYLDIKSFQDSDDYQKEMEIANEKAIRINSNVNIQDKIKSGFIEDYIRENVFLEQYHVKYPDVKVKQLIGDDCIFTYKIFTLGEGSLI